MAPKRLAVSLFCTLVFAAVSCAQGSVITVTTVQKTTPDGVEPAEWQLTNGWSIVTNKMAVGAIRATGPSVCETPYDPFTAYELHNRAASSLFPRWEYVLDPPVGGSPIPKQNMGRGVFYASCDRNLGLAISDPTPSSVWLGTDQHGGRSLVGVKLRQITKMKYYALVSGIPTRLAPGTSDSNWDSWKQAWYNPRFPIMLTLTVEGPAGQRQLWFRPWGDHSTIGDQASDGRLSVFEQYDCMQARGAYEYGPSGGAWLCRSGYSWDQGVEYESWSDVLADYGDYTLVSTSTAYDPGNGQWKSVGWTDASDPADPDPPEPETAKDVVTDPPGHPLCTGTGKCLNFWVGARFYRLKRPDENGYKTWWPESFGGRFQMDWFEFAVNYGTPENPDIVDVTYDFEPSPDDPGPRFVYINQAALNDVNNADTLIEKRGEPTNQYDPIENPLKNKKEERLYDVFFKVSGKVTAKLNAYSVLNDGANLGLPTRVYMVIENPRPMASAENPTNPMQVGQHWLSWGLLERFRPTGKAPVYTKPFIVWVHRERINAADWKLWP